jgi:hypothetical protein
VFIIEGRRTSVPVLIAASSEASVCGSHCTGRWWIGTRESSKAWRWPVHEVVQLSRMPFVQQIANVRWNIVVGHDNIIRSWGSHDSVKEPPVARSNRGERHAEQKFLT